MTEIIKRSTRQAMLWSPVMLRGMAWVIAEVSIAAAALLNEMEKSQSATTQVGWMIFGFTLLGKAAMTIRLYMDQSLSTHQERLNETKAPLASSSSGASPVV